MFFAGVRERFALQDSVEELWTRYRKRHPELIPVFSGVTDGLARLKEAGWKVGVVTNGFADVQLATLTHTGVIGFVDGWAISGVEGVRKPDVRLFELAARRCDMSLVGGGWMVGDSLVADIGGGRAAGLRTIWIDRGTWPTPEHDAHHVVTDVLQAMEILQTER